MAPASGGSLAPVASPSRPTLSPMRRQSGHSTRAGRVASALTTLVLVGACTGGGGSTAGTSTTDVGTTTTTLPTPRRPGPLRIGVLLPAATTNASFGAPLLAAVRAAVDDINLAGGVNGDKVELVPPADEGPDLAATITRLNALITDNHVDAVIGPTSSRSALAAIDIANRTQTAMCSPTARTMSLATYPGNHYFFRTMPSDELEASALARMIVLAGRTTSTALVYSDDEYGLAMANTMRAALGGNVTTVLAVPYETGTTDLTDPVAKAVAATPETVVVIGGSDDGARVLAELTKQAVGRRTPVFVTDAMLRTDLIDDVAPGRPDGLVNVKGVAPAATPKDPTFAARLGGSSAAGANFAAYAYDCVNLIALAAQSDRTNDPRVFGTMIADVSQVGSTCSTFAECAGLLAAGRNIDLQGQSGALDIGNDGDVGSGRFDVFEYDKSGRDFSDSTLTIGADGN